MPRIAGTTTRWPVPALLTHCHVSRRRSVEWGDSGGQFGSREPILMPHCGHCSVREAAVGAYWSSITS